MKIIKFVSRIFVVIGISVLSWGFPAPRHASYEAASKGIETFKLLVDEDSFRTMGFESFDEIGDMELGEMIPIVTFSLKKLKTYETGDLPITFIDNYQAGDDYQAIINKIDEVIYPVFAKGELRSSIGLLKNQGNWQAVNYGDEAIVKAIKRVKDEIMADPASKYTNFFLVELPAMHISLMGYREDGIMMMTSIYDTETYGLKAGKILPAEQVLPQLAEHIREFEESVP